MKKAVFATRNKHKVAEVNEIFKKEGIEIELITLAQAGFEGDIEEDGATFEENALIKARAASKALGIAAIADDSGLSVDVLGGAPGIYSARYASTSSGNASDKANVEKLLNELAGVPDSDRTARFVSAVAYVEPDGNEIVVRGVCEGIITRSVMGEGGFGYDPVFFYEPFAKTFGEVSEEEKNSVSHRANALKLLCEKLR